MGRVGGWKKMRRGKKVSPRVAGEETNHGGEKSIGRFVKIVKENEHAYWRENVFSGTMVKELILGTIDEDFYGTYYYSSDFINNLKSTISTLFFVLHI